MTSMHVKAGEPAYVYTFLGLAYCAVAATHALLAGPATVVLAFAYDA